MLILKHLKTLQHVSIIIQIIFRELVCSILKSLILKICSKCKKSNVTMLQHNVWCVCVCARAHTHTHTKHYAAASPQLTSYIFNIFLNSVTLTTNIRAP